MSNAIIARVVTSVTFAGIGAGLIYKSVEGTMPKSEAIKYTAKLSAKAYLVGFIPTFAMTLAVKVLAK